MKKICSFVIILLCMTGNFKAMAQQEVLVPLGSNSVIEAYLKDHSDELNKVYTTDTLELPVIDDFSNSQVFPDAAIWTDKYVFINDDFARNPISIGVATFDGLNQYGLAYNNSFSTASGPADSLTSKPINLFVKPASAGGGTYSIADSITLSFFYERKGWGDAPETFDSLVVEYYNPITGKWSQQWSATGPVTAGMDSTFTRADLRLTNPAFLQPGFRFRFRSYGSLTGAQDHWHVDYVRFYAAYNTVTSQMDTVLKDITFTQPGASQLNGYTGIPWDHFTSISASAQQALLNSNTYLYYRVNGSSPVDVGFNNRIYDYAGNYVAGFGDVGGNIFPQRPNNMLLSYFMPVDSIFPNTPSMTPDSTFFIIKNYFSNSSGFDGLKTNDSTLYKQVFYNYYSSDDGTAEAGYDLISSPNGKVAMRFDILKPDTLRAISIHFVQQLADVSNLLFTLKVWSSLNPETVIYQETGKRPAYIDSINGFANYVLSQIVPVSGTIYIGFQQVSPDGLHLGFDRNTKSNTRMFYNTSGTWQNVAVANGSFMMRAVMGDTMLFVGLNETQLDRNVNIYPNPADHFIQIKTDKTSTFNSYEIYSVEGKQIDQKEFKNIIETNQFQDGIYIIRLNSNNGFSATRKFTVMHNR